MSTVRAYINTLRIATGRITKDGRFIQVFPSKMYYDNENAWRDEILKTFTPTFVVENSTNLNEYSKITIQTLPAGRYYIGDICYSMTNTIYKDIFGKNGYSSGYYITNNGCFMVDSTAYGDGMFKASNGDMYNVDAGIIGIASLSLCDYKDEIYGGTVHTFTEPVKCIFMNGIFEFISSGFYLRINTGPVGRCLQEEA